MAIIEAVEFSSIPVKVTLNEYIEIAKYYSTEKSGIFINGMIDKIYKQLIDEKIIVKEGRGLTE
jgi:N utilization substance protein B